MSKCLSCASCREDSKKKEKKTVPKKEIRCSSSLEEVDEDVVLREVLVERAPPRVPDPEPEPLPPPPPPTTARLRVHVRCGATDIEAADVVITPQGQAAHPAVPTGNDGFADCGMLLAGPWSVTVGLNGLHHNDESYVAPAAATPVDLVAGVDQDVTVDVDPMIRLRLGHQEANVAARTWLRVWLPVAAGSRADERGHFMWLTFDVPAGQLSYHGTDPANAQLAAYDAVQTWRIHAAGAGGWHYFQLLGATASITVELHEQGFARETADHDSAAVIPWNFYFWSNSRLMAANPDTPVAFLDAADGQNASTRSPFQDFDGEFGLGTASFDWESNPAHDGHNDLALLAPNPKTWEGHCNWMGAASIIFRAPVNHARFDAENLKLLASEYAANNVQSESLWSLEEVLAPHAHQVLNVSFANAVVNYPLAVLDPGRVMPPNKVVARAQDAVALAPALATAASTFFGVLRRRIGELGQLVTSDLRASYDPSLIVAGTPNPQVIAALQAIGVKAREVWNQTVFFYSVSYIEHPNAGAAGHATELRTAQDLRATLTFYANSDGVLPTDHQPARFENDDIVIEANNWSRRARLRLQFTNGGDFDPNAAENAWETCTSIDGLSHYFMPRTLDRITGIRVAPANGGGNPFVTLARLQTLGLVLRAINA